MSSKKYWVWLSMVFGGGTNRLWQSLSYYSDLKDFCSDLIAINECLKLTQKDIQNIQSYNLNDADVLIRECDRKGISIVTYEDAEYPRHLRFISDPPPVLFCLGNTACLSGTKTVTSVGTRKAGEYSISACKRVCSELALKDFVIVSGFALGIDITSHLAAVDVGKPTICVLGCGVDVDYPKENYQFKQKILQSGGVFVSEYPPGTKPLPGNFPRRNRILSSIGKLTIVFEASEKSGSLITAKMSADQGHEVFVLPPCNIFSPSYGGNIKLMKEGAVPLTSVEDIEDFFRSNLEIASELKRDVFAFIFENMLSGTPMTERNDINFGMINGLEEYDEENDCSDELIEDDIISDMAVTEETEEDAYTEKTVENPAESEKNSVEYEGIKREIVEILKVRGRLHADIICNELLADSAEIMTELTELELLGAVKVCPGRMYELTD